MICRLTIVTCGVLCVWQPYKQDLMFNFDGVGQTHSRSPYFVWLCKIVCYLEFLIESSEGMGQV